MPMLTPIDSSAKLGLDFYSQTDTLVLAKSLLGCTLYSQIDGQITAGIITETEAYLGEEDKASHAFNGLKSNRTKTMYEQGGIAYVYLCYGMHYLFNVVTHQKDTPHAILVRAIEPTIGIETMQIRRGNQSLKNLTNGPAKLASALGINKDHNALSLLDETVWIAPSSKPTFGIVSTTRIGVDYAQEDALLPYRFYIEDSKFISKK
jgi:DNA-3-methyladenine glycosylase